MRQRRLIALMLLSLFSAPARSQQHFAMPPPEVSPPHAGGKRVTADRLFANWYPAGTGARGTILLLGGSEGGLGSGAAAQADALVAEGFAVMQLAYFGAPGLPAKLDMVPLEYFDRALAWIKQQPRRNSRIGIVGVSKGAEAALLIAAHHPEIRAVVVGAPSAVVWPGIDFTGGPTDASWSRGGKPLPYLRYGADTRSIFAGYQSGLATLPAHRAAAIPVRSITARMLFVCGEADTLWPSCPMARMAAQQVGAKAKVLAYRDAGHAVFGAPLPPGDPSRSALAALGGTPDGNAAARAEAWPQAVAFLRTALARN